jgi:hypothetical protein
MSQLSANALSTRTLPRIISLSGLAGAGKDTVADMLCSDYGYQRISFAAALKDCCAAIFGWDREMLEGRTAEARDQRERADDWWSTRLSAPAGFTPRKALQQLGTDVMRNHFHPDIWLAALERRILTAGPDDRFVITDCRFPNELACLQGLGAAVWWIRRGVTPTWWQAAQRGEEIPGVHRSETLWVSTVVGTDCAVEISNDGTIGELAEQIKELIDATKI